MVPARTLTSLALPDNGLQTIDDLLDGEPIGQDLDGVGGLNQRADRTAGVPGVPAVDLPEDIVKAPRFAAYVKIGHPTFGPHLGTRGQEDFALRIREDHRALISPLGDHILLISNLPLKLNQMSPDLGIVSRKPCHRRDFGGTDQIGHILAVEEKPLVAHLDLQLSRQPHHLFRPLPVDLAT